METTHAQSERSRVLYLDNVLYLSDGSQKEGLEIIVNSLHDYT